MLPDQRVGCCSCTCRGSTRPMRATTLFFAVCILAHRQESSLQDAGLQEVFFVAPRSRFQLVWQKKWSFMICITTCSLIHLFMLMSMQSVIHIHTHIHTHIDETHNAPHTAHTNSHDICNRTASINNRHRQAHIDHDIQSTFHILPHIHNMCTQLITPCDRYSLQCCVSKHITTICVQPHHCCMHVAQAQLCFTCKSALF